MKLLDLTLPTLVENLALDEALLETAEESLESLEVLRLWESPQMAVVIGRSSHVEKEVNVPYCRQQGISILRRCSGGAAVVIGPGCFMYAVVLNCELRPQLRMVTQAHQFVLQGVMRALRQLNLIVQCHEPCDLTLGVRKISGNSLRCKRRSLLYHGTILYGLPSEWMEQCLHAPPRQPEYRQGRGHRDFVVNASVHAEQLRQSFIQVWQVTERLENWPRELTAQLAEERYSSDDWNFRL